MSGVRMKITARPELDQIGWYHEDGSRCQHFSIDRDGCVNASNGTWRPVFIVVGPPDLVAEVARQARMAVE